MSGGHGPSGPSLKSLYFIFIATFLFGFVSGAVLYLINATGNNGNNAPRLAQEGEFTIIAYMYGGCARGGNCASYRIEADGSYTYLVRNLNDGQIRSDDSLSRGQLETLESQLNDASLAALSKTEFSGTCPAEFDGIAYRYDIEYKGVPYTFDSCVEDIAEDPFFSSLSEYFEIFSLVHNEE